MQCSPFHSDLSEFLTPKIMSAIGSTNQRSVVAFVSAQNIIEDFTA